MTRWVLLVTFRPDASGDIDPWLADVNELTDWWDDVVHSSAGRHCAGSVGPGDATWDLRTSGRALDAIPAVVELATPGRAPVLSCERLALDLVASSIKPFDGPRIKRTLLVTVEPGTHEDETSCFERSLLGMPHHIPSIRSWALSRVDATRSTGPWTHVWEQEFADLEGLRGAYMRDPYHWTGVERWFDPEIPGSIVEPAIAHLFRAAATAVLTDEERT